MTDPRYPSLYVVGGQKCGTTTVYGLLRQHPEIFLPEQKETHFFATGGKPFDYTDKAATRLNEITIHREEDYLDRYAGAGDRVAGEVCPTYLYSNVAAAAIAKVRPDAKIVAILRDPVNRSFSAYRHMRARGAEAAQDMGAALEAEASHIRDNWQVMSHYLAGSRYADQLARYYEHFPREQILIVPFEQLTADPIGWTNRICAHVGASPLPSEAALAQTNKTYQIDNSLVKSLTGKRNPLANTVRRMLPQSLRARLRELVLGVFAKKENDLSDASRLRLEKCLRDDARRTRELTGLPFENWSI